MKVLKRILTTLYRKSDDETGTTGNKCWENKKEKVVNRINHNRISINDVKVFTKRWEIKRKKRISRVGDSIRYLQTFNPVISRKGQV